MYGYEELGIPSSKLYTKPYAAKALEATKAIIEYVEKLFEEYLLSK